MSKGSKYFILSTALHLLATAATVFILVVIPWKLYNVKVTLNQNPSNISNVANIANYDTKCLLDPGTTSNVAKGSKFCPAIIGFAVCSLIFGAIVSLLTCCCSCLTANAFKLSHIITIISDIALAVCWGILLGTMVPRVRAAGDAGFPESGYRTGVLTATIVALVSFILDVFVNIFGISKSVSS